MRGADGRAGSLFNYVDLEGRVPSAHPLRAIRLIVNEALGELSPVFAKLYAPLGRPGIPPEQLLRGLLAQVGAWGKPGVVRSNVRKIAAQVGVRLEAADWLKAA